MRTFFFVYTLTASSLIFINLEYFDSLILYKIVLTIPYTLLLSTREPKTAQVTLKQK